MRLSKQLCAHALLAVCGLCGFGTRAAAQAVVLARPTQRERGEIDAFNRLAAELRIHHFETVIADVELGADPPAALAAAAKEHDALAAIAVVYHDGRTTLDVWLVDRLTGKTSVRTVDVADSADAPSLVAVRAVDLLRASLLELAPGEAPPPDLVDVQRGPIPQAASELAAEPQRTFSLAAEAVALRPGRRFGLAFGPALGLFVRTSERVELGLMVAAPLTGTSLDTARGAAQVRQELAWVEARAAIVDAKRFRLEPLAAVGGYLLDAEGQAKPPLISESNHALSAWFAVGLRAELVLFPRVRIGLALRAFLLAPRIAVAVADESAAIERPAFEASAGVAVGL